MKQAKVLTSNEMKRLLAVIAAGNHANRNRLAIQLSHFAGLRVGEIAQLRFGDVLDKDGIVKREFTLSAAITKSKEARRVFVSDKLEKELKTYIASLDVTPASNIPLIRSQARGAFSANSLCQLFGSLYKKAGIEGATSHSGRRSYISSLAHNGISAKVIMTLAGHKHLGTTQRYIDVNDEMMRQAVEVV
jgi:integrase/recombinase XerD